MEALEAANREVSGTLAGWPQPLHGGNLAWRQPCMAATLHGGNAARVRAPVCCCACAGGRRRGQRRGGGGHRHGRHQRGRAAHAGGVSGARVVRWLGGGGACGHARSSSSSSGRPRPIARATGWSGRGWCRCACGGPNEQMSNGVLQRAVTRRHATAVPRPASASYQAAAIAALSRMRDAGARQEVVTLAAASLLPPASLTRSAPVSVTPNVLALQLPTITRTAITRTAALKVRAGTADSRALPSNPTQKTAESHL